MRDRVGSDERTTFGGDATAAPVTLSGLRRRLRVRRATTSPRPRERAHTQRGRHSSCQKALAAPPLLGPTRRRRPATLRGLTAGVTRDVFFVTGSRAGRQGSPDRARARALGGGLRLCSGAAPGGEASLHG